jgi:hypothetical protein
MTIPKLTALLAQRVMRWNVAPGRYLMENRRWTPAWRFQPAKRIEDAFRLLDAADPEECRIISHRGGPFTVRVQIGGTAGEAAHASRARAITLAIACAVGLDPERPQCSKTGARQ